MSKLLGALLGALATLAIIAGGPAVWWYDHRPVNTPPPIRLHFLFWTVPIGLPPSLASRLATADADAAAAKAAYGLQLAAADSRQRLAQGQIDVLNVKVGAAEAAAQKAIRANTAALVKEIPDVITPATDLAFALPVGLVREHDAAALGVGLSQVPTGGRADDQASPVTASQLAAAIVPNYGECRADAERLNRLLDYGVSFNAVVDRMNAR